jgi:hypothetical protein
MPITNLKTFGTEQGLSIPSAKLIVQEAANIIAERYGYDPTQIKENFDQLIDETAQEAYRIYLDYEAIYGQKVFEALARYLVESGELNDLGQLAMVLPEYFHVFDKFYLSLSQSRRTRAGASFEDITNSLFRTLNYPFEEQRVINGKPDFLMPSEAHYHKNPMDCIIFTSKRTLRERWRQVATEGTRGLGTFLATIDEGISINQLSEMLRNRVYLVVPHRIREDKYPDAINVLSFRQFFLDHVDPAIDRWRRNKVI